MDVQSTIEKHSNVQKTQYLILEALDPHGTRVTWSPFEGGFFFSLSFRWGDDTKLLQLLSHLGREEKKKKSTRRFMCLLSAGRFFRWFLSLLF